jgi:hypothetical protein
MLFQKPNMMRLTAHPLADSGSPEGDKEVAGQYVVTSLEGMVAIVVDSNLEHAPNADEKLAGLVNPLRSP